MQCHIPSWCNDIYFLIQGKNFRRIWQKSGLAFLATYIIDLWHHHSAYVACQGLPDLGNGPNKPTAAIIGECSATYHHGAMISIWFRARISGSDKKSGLTLQCPFKNMCLECLTGSVHRPFLVWTVEDHGASLQNAHSVQLVFMKQLLLEERWLIGITIGWLVVVLINKITSSTKQ